MLVFSTVKDIKIVCILTPYQDVFSTLKHIKWLENCSGKSWLSSKLVGMAGLFLKSPYSLMHKLFPLLSNSFLIHTLKK